MFTYGLTQEDVAVIIEKRLACCRDVVLTFYCKVGDMPKYRVYSDGILLKETAILGLALSFYNGTCL